MPYDNTPIRRPWGLADRLMMLLGRRAHDNFRCQDRMAALDDPATRHALKDLPDHILRDIGAEVHASTRADVEGEALRKHLW